MSEASSPLTLSLFHTRLCPYCARTRRAVKKLGLSVVLKDVSLSRNHRNTLIAGGGKNQVPCLHIESRGKPARWLYESADIIEFLTRHHQQRGQ